MSNLTVCGRCVSSLLCMLTVITTSLGHETASLPELGVEMRISGAQDLPLTPATIERGDMVRPEIVEVYHILPLRWELQKRRLYQDLMSNELASIAEELDKAFAEQEQLTRVLTAFGTTTLEQLEENNLSLQAAKLEAAVLEAESAALRDAIDQRKETIANQGGEKIDEAIRLQNELIHMAQTMAHHVAGLRESGTKSASELAEADAEVLRVRRELALMEAEAMQQNDAILDAVLKRLVEIEPQQKATAAKIEKLSGSIENAVRVRQLIHEKEQAKRQIELLGQRMAELTTRLREQKLRTEYLEHVLTQYESALKKATSPSAEEQAD